MRLISWECTTRWTGYCPGHDRRRMDRYLFIFSTMSYTTMSSISTENSDERKRKILLNISMYSLQGKARKFGVPDTEWPSRTNARHNIPSMIYTENRMIFACTNIQICLSPVEINTYISADHSQNINNKKPHEGCYWGGEGKNKHDGMRLSIDRPKWFVL